MQNRTLGLRRSEKAQVDPVGLHPGRIVMLRCCNQIMPGVLRRFIISPSVAFHVLDFGDALEFSLVFPTTA